MGDTRSLDSSSHVRHGLPLLSVSDPQTWRWLGIGGGRTATVTAGDRTGTLTGMTTRHGAVTRTGDQKPAQAQMARERSRSQTRTLHCTLDTSSSTGPASRRHHGVRPLKPWSGRSSSFGAGRRPMTGWSCSIHVLCAHSLCLWCVRPCVDIWTSSCAWVV